MPPRMIAPLRLDSTSIIKGDPEVSPSRSSIQSSGPSRVHTPSSSVPNTPLIAARPSSPEKRLPHPADPNSFLTALATQERRVLELKEELEKAEAELEKLKKQWASQEATRKRNELRHLEQLQPLNTSFASISASQDEESTHVNKELGKRNKTSSGVKASQRTVFSGSRHTRTLSLLSPKESAAGSHPPLPGKGPLKRPLERINDIVVPSTVHELGTSTDGPNVVAELYKGPSREIIVETGKQLVGDFRQGLWTFFDDLRQVTVGDEAASRTDPRVQSSLHSSNPTKRNGLRERGSISKECANTRVESQKETDDAASRRSTGDPATELGSEIAGPDVLVAKTRTSTTEYDLQRNANNSSSDSDDEDGWENWDTSTSKNSTPRRADALYVVDSVASPLTAKSSPRTSMR